EAPPTVEELLQQAAGSIDLQDVMLMDALDYLRDTYQIPLHQKWRHLADVGVTRGMRVTISVQDVTVAEVLTQLLDAIGSAPIGYEIRDRVVLISTEEDLAANTMVRLYSIHALFPIRELGAPEPEEEPVVEVVIGRITDSVTSDKWASGDWVIRHTRGYLLITATPEAHAEIAELLEQIHQDHEQALQDQ
ncbi:MAG: STN domain-containing protein, partial [Planctomycetota bacterium]